MLLEISLTLCNYTLMNELRTAVHISSVHVKEQLNGIDVATLAQNFGVGLDTTQRTLRAMTQWGVRTVLNPTLSHRFQTND